MSEKKSCLICGKWTCPLCLGKWSPYLVGAGIGLLSILTFWLVDKPIGMSTSVAAASGACMMPVVGMETVQSNTYWAKKAIPSWNYGMLFLVGSILGATVSSLRGGTFRWEVVPSVWLERFGGSVALRLAASFVGGIVLLYGARLADGCTSGHGISGSLQLAVSSWTFFLVMFVSGLVTAWMLFGFHPSLSSDKQQGES